jgi:hypothetical protein
VRRAIRRRLPNSAALTCAGFKTKKGNILAGSHYSKHGTELGLYRIFAVRALMRLPSLEKPGGAVRGQASSESATSSSSTPIISSRPPAALAVPGALRSSGFG